MSNKDELRKLANQVNDKARRVAEKKVSETRKIVEDAESAANEENYKYFLRVYKQRMQNAAGEGKYRTKVYELCEYDVPPKERNDLKRSLSGPSVTKEDLYGAAKKIWDFLEKEKLEPLLTEEDTIIDYDSEGMHMRQYHLYINVSW